ncbi:MAG: hypothetical protein M3290_04615, partial [Actinomycetota bacterium]|nr:hypothetical protein [Actinomycetota bacterium]
SYVINDVIPLPLEGAEDAARIPLFSADKAPKRNLNGFQRVPAQWGVQWKYLLPGIKDPSTTNNAHLPQPSYKIDAQLSHPLGALPGVSSEDLPGTSSPEDARDLATRNLLRGRQMGLPSGQAVARAMGIEALSDDELFGGVEVDAEAKADLAGNAPLWFYVLKEAEVLGDGGLGPVGGRIVAEVLVGLACGDPLSFINVEPTWTPTLPAAETSTFTLSDLVNFARPLAPNAPPSPPAPGKSW